MRPTLRAGMLACATLVLGAGPPLRAQTTHNAPVISLAPHNPGYVNTNLGAATLSFSNPSYVSLGQERSVALVYNSTQAQGIGFVQVDATDNSSTAPAKMSIQVYDPSGPAVTSETFYTAATGANRLAATFVATTSAKVYRVVVKSYWSDGTTMSSEVQTRIIVLDERTSVVGAGWTVAGFQRITSATDGALVNNGDGTAVYFYRSCTTCAFQAPDGDFSTLVKNADGTWVRTYPNGVRATFDAYGLISRYITLQNDTTLFDWNWAPDGRRLPHGAIDPKGKVIVLNYNATTGMLTSIADPMGRTMPVGITGADLTSVTGADGRTLMTVSVDASHRLSYWLDQAGGRWDVAYDNAGGLASVTAPQVSTTDAGLTRPVTQTKSLWAAILPGAGLGTSASPAPRVDPAAVRVSMTDARGNVVRAAVDRFGSPTRVEEPYGRVTTITRNQHSQVTRTVAPSGHAVSQTWNGPDLTQTLDETLHDTVTVTYAPTYHQPVSTRHRAQIDSVYYAANGLPDSAVTRGDTRTVVRYTWDARGRIASATDPRGHGSFFGYDDAAGHLGNLYYTRVGAEGSTGGSESYTYFDAYGRDTMSVSPNNDTTKTAYDVLNRAVRSVGALHDTTVIAYDSLGLRTVTDAKHQGYTYARNALGWVTSETDPRGTTLQYRYDRAGNQTGFTNRRSKAVTMAYDSLNRLYTRDADFDRTTWTYDPNDLWWQVTAPVGTDRFEFDAAGMPLRHIATMDGKTYTVASTFDSRGLRTQLTATGPWTGSRSLRYHYDSRFQLDSITDFSGGTSAVSYDLDGMRNLTTLPNGSWLQRDYMSLHVPDELAQHGVGMSDALHVSYGVDARGLVGTRTTRYHGNAGETGDLLRRYSYDRAGQLKSAVDSLTYDPQWICPVDKAEWDPNLGNCYPNTPVYQGSQGWNWDILGNPAPGATTTVETGNRLTRLGNLTVEYDADGNVTREYRNDGVTWEQRFYWNTLGQLDSVNTNGVMKRYGYNGLGQRVRERDNSGNVSYLLYDGDNPLMTLSSSGIPILKFSFYPGVDNPHSFTNEATGATYYYESDSPGNVTGLVGTNGHVAVKYDYDPFGSTTVVYDSASVSGQPLRYMGREFDATTGLYYLRNRWYDPAIGRFISEDPIGLEGGINLFAFVGNSPTNLRDPFGTDPVSECIEKLQKAGATDEFIWQACVTGFALGGVTATSKPFPPQYRGPRGGGPGGSGPGGTPMGPGPGGPGGGSQPSAPLPSCRSIDYWGGSGRISVQTSPSGYVQWGIYMDNPLLNYGPWKASIFVGGAKRDGKSQFYPPHGSLPPQKAPSGSVLMIQAEHTDMLGVTHTSIPNACIIP